MQSELEAAISRLESVDEKILATLREAEASEPPLAFVLELLQTRAGLLHDVCAQTKTSAPVSYEIFNRLIVTHERGQQAQSALHNLRDNILQKLAESQTCGAYAMRVTALLRACRAGNAPT